MGGPLVAFLEEGGWWWGGEEGELFSVGEVFAHEEAFF